MLVFRRVHVAAELVGGKPELLLEAEVCGGVIFSWRTGSRHRARISSR